jgi:hypothetical protein
VRHPLPLAVGEEGTVLAREGKVQQCREVPAIELEGARHLLTHLPHAVDKLDEDGRELLVRRRMPCPKSAHRRQYRGGTGKVQGRYREGTGKVQGRYRESMPCPKSARRRQ